MKTLFKVVKSELHTFRYAFKEILPHFSEFLPFVAFFSKNSFHFLPFFLIWRIALVFVILRSSNMSSRLCMSIIKRNRFRVYYKGSQSGTKWSFKVSDFWRNFQHCFSFYIFTQKLIKSFQKSCFFCAKFLFSSNSFLFCCKISPKFLIQERISFPGIVWMRIKNACNQSHPLFESK